MHYNRHGWFHHEDFTTESSDMNQIEVITIASPARNITYVNLPKNILLMFCLNQDDFHMFQ